jgi:adenylosuccinate synthase
LAVIGAQYGSEGKGNFVHKVRNRYGVHVRVGGPNAGHSFKHEGTLYKMQSIPCGWTNRDAALVIGRGALVSVEQLAAEWRMVSKVDPSITERLYIDRGAGIVSPWHHSEAGGVHGEAHKRYGSTGEGVGVARIARIQRYPGDAEKGSGFFHAGTLPLSMVPSDFRAAWENMLTDDTPGLIEDYVAGGTHVLLEGTQGSALSLIHGPWPYVTNHDCNAAQLAADCGIPPRYVNRCMLVMRTMPIRVAGNSGPMQHELSWDDVSKRVGKPVTEQTTVTKKTRRVAEWDEDLIHRAVCLNGPTSIAVSFIDYLSPEDEGKTEPEQLSDKAWSFIEYVYRVTSTPVLLVGTGGETDWNVVHLPHPQNGSSWRL